MSDAIQQALAMANSAAATLPALNANATPQAPAVLPAQAQRLSLSDAINASGLAVDKFLQFDKMGFQVGKEGLYKSLIVGIRLGQVKPVRSVRWGDNPVKYAKSEDRVTTIGSPLSWQRTLEIAAADAKPGAEYITYETPMELLEDAQDCTNPEQKLLKGVILGHTPSVTNARDFAALFSKAMDASFTAIKVEMVHKQKAKGTTSWGACSLNLLGEWDEDEDAE